MRLRRVLRHLQRAPLPNPPPRGEGTPPRLAALVLLAGLAMAPLPVHASAEGAMALCRNAAIAAADRHGIPREVMVAITLVETRTKRGGVSGPWPWTVNVAGKGAWFDSRAAALIHAQQALAGGQTSFDVGCFQLNYKWHGSHFGSIDEMFEPAPSGDYAARFLKSLHAETGDWIRAAGLYHSRTAKHAKRYRTLVARTVRGMGGKVPEQVVLAGTATGETARPRVFRADDPAAGWPLRDGRIRTPAGTGNTAGAVALNILRRSRGSLLGVN